MSVLVSPSGWSTESGVLDPIDETREVEKLAAKRLCEGKFERIFESFLVIVICS